MNPDHNPGEQSPIAEQVVLHSDILRKIAYEELHNEMDPVALLINIAFRFREYLVEIGEDFEHEDIQLITREIIETNRSSETESIQETLERIAEVEQIPEHEARRES